VLVCFAEPSLSSGDLFFVYLYIAASGPLEEENFADAAEN
jgi:hypothetical protein